MWGTGYVTVPSLEDGKRGGMSWCLSGGGVDCLISLTVVARTFIDEGGQEDLDNGCGSTIVLGGGRGSTRVLGGGCGEGSL